jgi:hypothetical protein
LTEFKVLCLLNSTKGWKKGEFFCDESEIEGGGKKWVSSVGREIEVGGERLLGNMFVLRFWWE